MLHNSSNCYVFLWANFPSYLHLGRDQICINNYLLTRPIELGEWMPLFRAQTKTSWYQWVGPWLPAVTSPSFRKLPRYTLVSGLVKLIEAFVYKLGWVREWFVRPHTLPCYAMLALLVCPQPCSQDPPVVTKSYCFARGEAPPIILDHLSQWTP